MKNTLWLILNIVIVILILAFFLAFLSKIVFARQYCVDNTTMLRERVTTYMIENETFTITSNETFKCDYGCENNDCILPNYIINGFILFGIFLIMVLTYFIYRWFF